MTLPNTILAGAQKSGTTALCRFLNAHPNCLVSNPKEPNFFSRADNVFHLDRYAVCFQGVKPLHRVLVDGTTTYMADPAIAPRIRQCLGGNVKIIFVLRSPTARAYSSFLHMLKRGHERRTASEVFLGLPDDPEAAGSAERKVVHEAWLRGRITDRPYSNLYDDMLWNYRYVGNSFYSNLVQNYLKVFGPENVLILYFEELTRDITVGRQVIASFLGVDPDLFPRVLGKGNETRLPDLSKPWNRLVEQVRWIKRGNFTLVRANEMAASPIMPAEAVREKLNRLFKTEVDYWSRREGHDLRAIGW